MPTRFFPTALCSALAALVFSVAADPAAAQSQGENLSGSTVAVKDYDVFVDLSTGFAFVKTPTAWKFIGKLDTTQMTHLPVDTLTSLLPASEVDNRYAQNGAARATVRAKPM